MHSSEPKKWAHLPNPISHHESFMMSDYLRLAMIMLFILHHFLKICVAQTMKIAFDRHFTNKKYIELQRCLDSEMNILTQVFEEFVNLPNLHLNFHFLLHAYTYTTLSNTQYITEDNSFSQDDYENETGDANFKAELYESYKDLKLNSALINSSLT
ncbi:hypothetical protein C1646_773863 [Rhizophagus diaphanus]|nr:hypothetical protein C1646_773863 [Rhizophagus diaphanus] [Rhizophagus sp. MUCL 43196]